MWQYIKRAYYRKKKMGDTAQWPPLLHKARSGGGGGWGVSEKFSVLAKRGELALFEFLGGSGFFQVSGAEDFLKVFLIK